MQDSTVEPCSQSKNFDFNVFNNSMQVDENSKSQQQNLFQQHSLNMEENYPPAKKIRLGESNFSIGSTCKHSYFPSPKKLLPYGVSLPVP